MAERINRDPTYDLGRHIGTGEKGALSGGEVAQPRDEELDRNDPMDAWTQPQSIDRMTLPLSAEQVQAINRGNATGLMSDNAMLDSQPVDNGTMSAWSDSPDKATDLTYGSPNTGAEYAPRVTGGGRY